MPKFKIIKKDKVTKARAGELITDHGILETPAFVPVGTQGTVKSLSPRDLKEIGVPIVLANTYHLHLRPGEKVISKLGGLAKWMSWDKPTMTDSGGFQVFSLGEALESGASVKFLREGGPVRSFPPANAPSRLTEMRVVGSLSTSATPKVRLNKITEEGVTFQSHIDGSIHKLTPESSIEIQKKLGADLIVGFDDLESPLFKFEETKRSLDLTNRWLLRSKRAHKKRGQLLFGVTHGGKFEELRIESAKFVDANFSAIALGGAHSSKKNMYDVVDWTLANVSDEKPRHQLGIGEIDDIFEIIERGVDTFDCVIPTREARHGRLYVSSKGQEGEGYSTIDIHLEKFKEDFTPVDNTCSCYLCLNHTKSYLRHLFATGEPLAIRLATMHNLRFYLNLMEKIRKAITYDYFEDMVKSYQEIKV